MTGEPCRLSRTGTTAESDTFRDWVSQKMYENVTVIGESDTDVIDVHNITLLMRLTSLHLCFLDLGSKMVGISASLASREIVTPHGETQRSLKKSRPGPTSLSDLSAEVQF